MVENGKVTSFCPTLKFYEWMEHNYQSNQEWLLRSYGRGCSSIMLIINMKDNTLRVKEELAFCW